jgi:hypothetical protein
MLQEGDDLGLLTFRSRLQQRNRFVVRGYTSTSRFGCPVSAGNMGGLGAPP